MGLGFRVLPIENSQVLHNTRLALCKDKVTGVLYRRDYVKILLQLL